MKEKYQVGVIGLGKFGFQFGRTLVGLGHEVLGIDSDPQKVRNAQQVLTQVFQADAIDKESLGQMGVRDLSYVLVSVGDSIAASTMICMYLKELGVEKVCAKAINKDHEKLLYKVGVDEVVIPEHMAAKQIATRVAMPGFIEHLPFDKSMGVKEFTVNKWSGRTLRKLDISNRFGVQVIALKENGTAKYRFIPKADDILKGGDVVVILGALTELEKIES